MSCIQMQQTCLSQLKSRFSLAPIDMQFSQDIKYSFARPNRQLTSSWLKLTVLSHYPVHFWQGRCHRKICRPEIVSRRQFFLRKIMSLAINVATVYPKEILSSGNTVARHGMRYTTASFLLQPNLYHPLPC